jgi:hypothetical protein
LLAQVQFQVGVDLGNRCCDVVQLKMARAMSQADLGCEFL